jgi:hypothetical protein
MMKSLAMARLVGKGHNWRADNIMRQLLYTSNTNRDVPETALESILAASRRNNLSAGVTGILLYIDGGFMQVLEGEPISVAETYRRICQDKRHWNTQVLLDRNAPRAFGEWSMGFIRPSVHEIEVGTFALTKDAIEGRLKPDAAPELLVLLRGFYRIQTA